MFAIMNMIEMAQKLLLLEILFLQANPAILVSELDYFPMKYKKLSKFPGAQQEVSSLSYVYER